MNLLFLKQQSADFFYRSSSDAADAVLKNVDVA